MDYIHYNPVKHGYVMRVADWRYSSFHRFVRLGVYPGDWGGSGLRDMDLVGVGMMGSLRSTHPTRTTQAAE